ncbi:Rho GTPase activating protein [Hypoxylon texense]
MNTMTTVAQRLDEWPEDTSAWTTPIFTSFGDGMCLPEHQFWSPNSPPTNEELGRGSDAADNFNSGYTIDSMAGLGPGTGSNGPPFKHQSHAAAKPTVGPDRSQPPVSFSFSGSKGPYDGNSHGFPVEEDDFFDNSPTTSTATALSGHLTRSPDTKKSPCYSPQSAVSSTCSIKGWMGDEPADQSSSASPSTGVVTATPRNRRNRERNRVAAHKCRQKAKRSMSELQEREKELSSKHQLLKQHADSLKSEIIDLKTEVLRHSGCNSEVIQSWIARSARELH